ncbi:helix-turn-helix domain-containing protein [Candidatus Poribacteria bacterium]|nr:helix-turn-helix domain-containing protein [Candidatus Poribacteria bacterium]
MTVTELAQRLNVTTQAIHNRIRRGTIKAEKTNGSWTISEQECKRLLNGLQTDVNGHCDTCTR